MTKQGRKGPRGERTDIWKCERYEKEPEMEPEPARRRDKEAETQRARARDQIRRKQDQGRENGKQREGCMQETKKTHC